MADMKTPGTMFNFAALFLALAGTILIAGSVMAGFHTPAPLMLGIGVLNLIVALLLRGGRRWLAYIAFLLTSFGAAIAYAYWGGNAELPHWAWLGASIASALSALTLFVIIWRNKPIPVDG